MDSGRFTYGQGGNRVYSGARITNYAHQANKRQSAAFNKLIDAITNVDANVIELANSLVNNASPAVRARLMDFVIALVYAQTDAYHIEGDTSEGPSNASLLIEAINSYGMQLRP